MTAPLANLRTLRDEMAQRGWVVACFPFTYKRHSYFVLPQRYVPPKVAPEYQLMELTFVDRDDLARTLTAPANSQKIDIGAKQLREFFRIAWAPNLGDLLTQFSTALGHAVPTHLPAALTGEERIAIVQQLDRSSSEDPGKVYCYAAQRNPARADGTPGQRSLYNSQKTDLLRPELFTRLRHDRNVSFRYSNDPADERTDEQILARFATR